MKSMCLEGEFSFSEKDSSRRVFVVAGGGGPHCVHLADLLVVTEQREIALDQCFDLFTEPEVLNPEESWSVPFQCQSNFCCSRSFVPPCSLSSETICNRSFSSQSAPLLRA